MINNQKLWNFATKYLPGGVCSSARMNQELKSPFYISRAKGSKVYDLDGNEYVDMCLSFGAALIGHGNPHVTGAIRKALDMGTMCAYENEWHSKLAQRITEIVPSIDMLRFTMTGTETTYYVVKLAREYTGRVMVVKFEGHFHGFNDYLAYNYWPSERDRWPKISPALEGLPEYLQQGVIVCPFNDFEQIEKVFKQRGDEIAAVITEPVNYNSGTILPKPGFLETLRELTSQNGSLLIFDEILSGFRTVPGCMQAEYGVTPDLCTLGKAIGGGLPLSLFGGKREIMEHIKPLGKAQHSGTYNGHIMEIMGGHAFLDVISKDNFYEKLLNRCERFYEEVNHMMKRLSFLGRVQGKGARFSFLFGPPAEREVNNYSDLIDNQWELLNHFYGACLNHGVYIHTMQHHGLSSAHSDDDIDRLLSGIEAALKDVMNEKGAEIEEAPASPF